MHWRASRLHFEDFLGVSAVDPFGGPFTAEWAPTGESIAVDASSSLLERLTAAGVSVPSSCRSGTCGTCRVRLLEGTPQHRDVVLTDEERCEQIITCVSRAEGTVRLAPL
ncbi:2Fe-2S iron-sulfur cluster binding domain-containing protein [Microbacterium sp. LRZ72]|nr:2Fe-2S iron-sulfur cluster binding domain-containing protein [Microbacterium sp. LRZ72]